ncbi:hypothetical protein KSC_095840 [Ktedonobacter sp. SOSP1-52]|nr:hypothetical protein KSC_095840 [Ktedonobacter sp. SOSP1-52]
MIKNDEENWLTSYVRAASGSPQRMQVCLLGHGDVHRDCAERNWPCWLESA